MLKREYIYFNGSSVARHDPGGNWFYFADHLGSARVMTWQNGATVEESDYYPFGGERVVTDSVGAPWDNNRKFTGQERDTESGLDYFGARHYGFTLGRFLQPDPAPPKGRHLVNPQKWNMYTYVLNNPLVLTDPDGRQESSARTIDVFLAMSKTDRNWSTSPSGARVYAPGPSWRGLTSTGAKFGYDVRVYGPDKSIPTDSITSSLGKQGGVTALVGHSRGTVTEDGGRFSANGIYIDRGERRAIGTEGVSEGGKVVGEKPSTNASVVLAFGCDTEAAGSAFNFTGSNQSLVTLNGGADGVTNMGTMEAAASAFLETYVTTNGNLEAATKAAQAVIDSSQLEEDKGDKIVITPVGKQENK